MNLNNANNEKEIVELDYRASCDSEAALFIKIKSRLEGNSIHANEKVGLGSRVSLFMDIKNRT